ncbi:hypothetical protein [Carboxylicivirga taeanensis]|uniref:hypothetical protein n=1 Tax=Carboxylicivirga taeanensis TaxID=1416875 RepID=UPI003F6DAD3D
MKAIITCIFLFVSVSISAKWVEAYIETNQNEIIYGKIQLPKAEFYTGAWYVKGFDWSYLNRYVRFKSTDTGKVIYNPEQIRGYGFKYRGEDYFYITQVIDRKSIVKSERKKAYFMNVVYNGSLMLCKYRKQLDEERPVAKIILYDEYYLYNEQLGFTKLQVDEQHQSLNSILCQYGVSAFFLRKVGPLSIHDVKKVLYQYDVWLSEQEEQIPLTI